MALSFFAAYGNLYMINSWHVLFNSKVMQQGHWNSFLRSKVQPFTDRAIKWDTCEIQPQVLRQLDEIKAQRVKCSFRILRQTSMMLMMLVADKLNVNKKGRCHARRVNHVCPPNHNNPCQGGDRTSLTLLLLRSSHEGPPCSYMLVRLVAEWMSCNRLSLLFCSLRKVENSNPWLGGSQTVIETTLEHDTQQDPLQTLAYMFLHETRIQFSWTHISNQSAVRYVRHDTRHAAM